MLHGRERVQTEAEGAMASAPRTVINLSVNVPVSAMSAHRIREAVHQEVVPAVVEAILRLNVGGAGDDVREAVS